ncbi:GerAB/ArcD/ProY family transporter [Paenibacillus sp. MMS18-CY102]|uniref:GerAB/ArcD/ProY family transporter n=1 Tax=Paenibacillus sp. MMS18-CY102 TaxID=2682849 RepID=UPI001365441E|nr:GerAB/ArcD/ProY family transporter [Paenibacillus sp. MMS18-CY102]MWC31297.1 GerAB/ArcD/ProY family transporter [Paenibacillus sp. MMS18-CY102]
MENAKITGKQLFALIVLFVFGTSIAINYGLSAKKDAWLAILLGTIHGCVLYTMYSYMSRQYPGMPLTRYARMIVGKGVGWLIGLLFVLYFIYDAARDVRDAGELLHISFYHQTPLIVLNVVMVATAGYVLYLGIEVLARIGEIFILIIFALGAIGNVLVYFSGIVDLNQLLPVLENGWKPIFDTAYPDTIIFPFGELVCICTVFPYLRQPNKQTRIGLYAILLAGLLLSYTIALDIAVLGADIAGRSVFALLTMISKVEVAEFLQRLDPVALFTLIIVDFFKVSLLYYGAVIGAADLFRFQTHKALVFPVGIVILLLSMFIASNMNEHLWEGQLSIAKFQVFITVALPLLLFIVLIVRKRFVKKT